MSPLPIVSIIVPTFNAEPYLTRLILALQQQENIPFFEIILIDSSSTDKTKEIATSYSILKFVQIPKQSFTHGYARNLGVSLANGSIIVFLSQDACPYDKNWLKNLLLALDENGVAAAYSRQIPYSNASPMEKHFLNKNFPDQSKILHTKVSKNFLRFKDVFFSNVSSATKKETLLKTPFRESLIMSEDQQFSLDLLSQGLSVKYEAHSKVWHSHQYTLKTLFQRYFDSAYSLKLIFSQNLKESVHIGRSYLKEEMILMVRKHPAWIPYYFCYLISKTLGAVLGLYADKLPQRIAKGFSLHKNYWISV